MALVLCDGHANNHKHDTVAYEASAITDNCAACQILEDIEDKQGDLNEIARTLDSAIDTIRQALDGRRKILIQMEVEPAMRESIPMFTAAEVDRWDTMLDAARTDLENFSIRD